MSANWPTMQPPLELVPRDIHAIYQHASPIDAAYNGTYASPIDAAYNGTSMAPRRHGNRPKKQALGQKQRKNMKKQLGIVSANGLMRIGQITQANYKARRDIIPGYGKVRSAVNINHSRKNPIPWGTSSDLEDLHFNHLQSSINSVNWHQQDYHH